MEEQIENKEIKNINSKEKTKKLKVIIIILFIIILVGGGYYLIKKSGYLETFRLAKQIQEKAEIQKADQEILAQLKEIILLPDDINPTIGIINDADKLKQSQPEFFKDAQNGQRLIIYPTQAIIYDAENNKIIKVGPVQLKQNEPAAPQAEVSE